METLFQFLKERGFTRYSYDKNAVCYIYGQHEWHHLHQRRGCTVNVNNDGRISVNFHGEHGVGWNSKDVPDSDMTFVNIYQQGRWKSWKNC